MQLLPVTRLKILLTLVAFLLAGGLFLSRLTRYDPLMGDQVVNPRFTSLTYGIQTFLWWDKTAASLHLDWVRLMVFSHVKQIFAWDLIEPQPGVWDFQRADEIVAEVEAKGLKLVVRLSDAPDWSHPSAGGEKDDAFHDAPPDDLADFGEYCGAVAARYKGRIAAYQIWNEPNLGREWGNRPPNAADYVALLRACSQAIRAADPAAILISAGLAPTATWTDMATPDDMYFKAMYQAGFHHDIDVAGVNAPGYNMPPEISPDEAVARGGQRFQTFRRVEDLRRIMVEQGDSARQMAILEMGWTTDQVNPDYAWFAVTEQQQADYFVRAYQYAAEHWRPWIGLVSAIYIPDPSWTREREEYWWSLFTAEGAMRPAFAALANMAKTCGSRLIPARAGDSPEALGLATVVPCS